MNYNTKSTVTLIALLVLLVVIIIFAPIAVIWSLNNLFALHIAYSFFNWLSVILLGLFIRPNVQISK